MATTSFTYNNNRLTTIYNGVTTEEDRSLTPSQYLQKLTQKVDPNTIQLDSVESEETKALKELYGL